MVGSTRVSVRGQSRRADCSGFVCACFEAADIPLIDDGVEGASGTERIWRTMARRGVTVAPGKARPGDVLVFDHTYDRNRNGRPDDPFSHVALVEDVDPDGTVTYLHYGSKGVTRAVMNVRHAADATDPATGKAWNSVLGTVGRKRLSGQLLRGVARPLP